MWREEWPSPKKDDERHGVSSSSLAWTCRAVTVGAGISCGLEPHFDNLARNLWIDHESRLSVASVETRYQSPTVSSCRQLFRLTHRRGGPTRAQSPGPAAEPM